MIEGPSVKTPQSVKVISKSYMTGLILRCGLFFAAGLVATGVILYYSAHQPLGPSYEESFARLAQLKDEMFFKSVIIYFLLILLILAGVIAIVVLYSHRVVGPTVSLKRTLGLLAGGDLTAKAKLRDRDAIQPMADAINEMTAAYKNRLAHIQQHVQEMTAQLESCRDEEGIASLREKARAIDGILKTINS